MMSLFEAEKIIKEYITGLPLNKRDAERVRLRNKYHPFTKSKIADLEKDIRIHKLNKLLDDEELAKEELIVILKNQINNHE